MTIETIDKNIHIEAAPLAGYTDRTFRKVLIECGAKTVYTEMISTTALCYNSGRTQKMLELDKAPGVTNVVQIFGNNPEHFERSIKEGHFEQYDEININMGCPAKKVVSNGDGAALMLDPNLAGKVIENCVKSTSKPVTVKMRLGYHPIDRDINDGKPSEVLELAKMSEDLGAAKVIVHGRVAAQGYTGSADYYAIKEVVDALSIPVIANGDITSRAKANECLEITGAQGIMLGRANIGSPWNITLPDQQPSLEQVVAILKRHLELAKINEVHFPALRKQLVEYFNHLPNGKNLKTEVVKLADYGQVYDLIEQSLAY